ncbi:hypothetical protein BC628DRAFT_1095225 [Trametes gibbosa]|nr:hypothetical protein BC628DRAFT_1095225 [Trametes gibbosa]
MSNGARRRRSAESLMATWTRSGVRKDRRMTCVRSSQFWERKSCNDFSAWPFPQIILSRPLDPYYNGHAHEPLSSSTPNSSDPIHVAIVTTLQKQLATEQKAHARTKQEADAEILRLQAMVARRDAELQACVTHAAHNVLLYSAPSDVIACRSCNPANRTGGHNPHGYASASCCGHASTTRTTSDSILARTASRNRMLEREVEILRYSVHRAQQSHSSEANKVKIKSGQPTEKQYASVQVQTDYPALPEDHAESLPPSPGLLPHTMPMSPSPYILTPRYSHTPSRTRSPGQLSIKPIDDNTSNKKFDLEHLRKDIDIIAMKIDDLVVERAAVKSMLAHSLPKASPIEQLPGASEGGTGSGLATYQPDEWARERQELLRKLEVTERERANREQELQAEVLSPQGALLESSREHATRPQPHPEGGGDSDLLKAASASSPRASPTLVPQGAQKPQVKKENAYEAARVEPHAHIIESEQPEHGDEFGEQPMELATPLLSMTILSIRADDWPVPPATLPINPRTSSEDVDPADIPLPTSPDIIPLPAVSSSRSLSPLRTPPSSTQPVASSSTSGSPQLHVARPHVSLDLITRIESAAQERVVSIEQSRYQFGSPHTTASEPGC